jgi:hypothetical protein
MPIVIDPSAGITGLVTPLAVPEGGTGGATGFSNIVQSMVRLHTVNGYGSTNTRIRRFTNVVTNQGADITYADSATLGASFTINTAGVYAISYSDQFNAVSAMGLSLNSTQLSVTILDITTADRLVVSLTAGTNVIGASATTVYLAAGSVIRAHTDSTVTGTSPNTCQFTITRVA